MKRWLVALQVVFYMFILGILVGRALAANGSHDENQFISAGQLLADHGRFPYIDYPYTHMPYAAAFYGATAALTDYDLLGGRLLNAVAWFLCAIVIGRAFGQWRPSRPTLAMIAWEFAVVAIFVFDPLVGGTGGVALNHSFASLFSLIALALLVRGLEGTTHPSWHAVGSGVFVSLAAWTRFNYAGLLPILGAAYMVPVLRRQSSGAVRALRSYGTGVLAAAVPVLILFAAAPRAFLYGNYVYIKLNTIYYAGLLHRANMHLGQKMLGLFNFLAISPLDAALYAVMAGLFAWALYRYVRSASVEALWILALAGGAAALAASAFAPTPTLLHYFVAPVPWLCVGALVAGHKLLGRNRAVLGGLAVLALLAVFTGRPSRKPGKALSALTDPSKWVPLQVHEFDLRLRQHAASGRVLTLASMYPLEAGLDAYPFTATGPFSWRTSLLLTKERRAQYGVTSPEELPALLKLAPPLEILTGFESTNAGFEFGDLGGLETPFTEYAQAQGFRSATLPAPFLDQTITLWWKQP